MSSGVRFRVLISDEAIADIQDAVAFVAIDAPGNAKRLRDRLFARIDSLSLIPSAFPIAPDTLEVEGELRHVFEQPFRIIFEVADRKVLVHHVRHASRRPIGREEVGE